MATIKAYTDLEQSKKLAGFLPHETADMYWYLATKGDPVARFNGGYDKYGDFELPCWSLAALLGILAKIASKIDDDGSTDLSSFMGQWSVNMFDCPVEATDNYDDPVDACYEMVVKLYEQNLLSITPS